MKSFAFRNKKSQTLPIQASLLTIPLKTTKDLNLKAAYESWTERSHPHLNASHVSDDIQRLQSLHSDIHNSLHTSTAHELALSDDALDTLIEYHACLLAALQRGYPADGSNAHINGSLDANLVFWWKHAFCELGDGHDEDTLSIKSQAHLNYERMGVLWNIAALHTCLARECDWSQKEGRTEAHRSYLLAARIFRHVLTLRQKIDMKDTSVTPDLKAASVEMCQLICQAQGQMIAYEALKEKLPEVGKNDDSILNLLSKVSAGVSDFLDQALKYSQHLSIRDNPSSVKWGRHVKAQSMLFRARSEFLASQVDHVNSKFGLEIARLAKAEEMAKEGVKFAKGSGVMPGVKGSIELLLKTIQTKLKTVTDENNTIYHERIPNTRALDQVKANDVMSLGVEVDKGCDNGQDFPEEFRPENLSRPMFFDAPKV